MDNKLHRRRVMSELKAAGMTTYGTMKMETERLPSIIHEEEHIGGVVYGRTTGQKIGSAMIIATDKRIIFLDVKPFYFSFDEVSYDVVSGVSDTVSGPFAGIILHTRVRDFGLRFVNRHCAEKFVEFIETHIELKQDENSQLTSQGIHTPKTPQTHHDENGNGLIRSLNEAVLSTVDREGNVHGFVVHYSYMNELFYFVSRLEDSKVTQVALHGQVALTIHATGSLHMVQVSGLAEPETDKKTIAKVFEEVSQPKNYTEGNHFPPIVTMKKGNFTVIRITPLSIKYYDYSKSSW